MRRVAFATLLVIGVVPGFGFHGTAHAAPSAVGATVGGINEASDCAAVQQRFDADRQKMEVLMGALQNEDARPESATRFKRMCAIDRSISEAARRLSALIGSSGKTCLSPDDRSQVAQMRHLSAPVPECAESAPRSAQSRPKEPVRLSKNAKSRPVTAASRVPSTQKLKRSAQTRGPAPMGLMSDLY
jgi:hypothetical protein